MIEFVRFNAMYSDLSLSLTFRNQHSKILILQAVVVYVSFDRVFNRIGALKEFLTSLVFFSIQISIQVFIKEFPHIIRERQDFQVFGISKTKNKKSIQYTYHSSFENQKTVNEFPERPHT